MPLSGGYRPLVPQWVTAASPEEEGTSVTDGLCFSKLTKPTTKPEDGFDHSFQEHLENQNSQYRMYFQF